MLAGRIGLREGGDRRHFDLFRQSGRAIALGVEVRKISSFQFLNANLLVPGV